jgi:hypothetical protein
VHKEIVKRGGAAGYCTAKENRRDGNRMKKLFVILLVAIAFVSNAQSKDEKELVARTYLLSHTVFGTKDSLTLEDLFAKQATYGHSHGNLQTREEAIRGASKNKSYYTDT